jgi:type IX secretion system PorP/SprF family membrane protein
VNKKTCILLFFFAACAFAVSGQDVVFSSPYSNPIYLNPAYTGLPSYWRTGGNFHSQGLDKISTYGAYSIYADYFWEEKNSAFGFLAIGDRMTGGSITKTQIAMTYMYRLVFNEKTYLRLSLQPALCLASYNLSSIIFPSDVDDNGYNDGNYSGGITSKPYFDLSLGMVFARRRFYTGFAVHHLATANSVSLGSASISTPPKFTFNMGYNYTFLLYENSASLSRRGGYGLTFSPNFMYIYQGGSNIFSLGTYVRLLDVAVGVHCKSSFGNSAYFFIVSAHYVGSVVGVSYNFEFGAINKTFQAIPANAHEITLSLKFNDKKPAAVQNIWRQKEIIYDKPDI